MDDGSGGTEAEHPSISVDWAGNVAIAWVVDAFIEGNVYIAHRLSQVAESSGGGEFEIYHIDELANSYSCDAHVICSTENEVLIFLLVDRKITSGHRTSLRCFSSATYEPILMIDSNDLNSLEIPLTDCSVSCEDIDGDGYLTLAHEYEDGELEIYCFAEVSRSEVNHHCAIWEDGFDMVLEVPPHAKSVTTVFDLRPLVIKE